MPILWCCDFLFVVFHHVFSSWWSWHCCWALYPSNLSRFCQILNTAIVWFSTHMMGQHFLKKMSLRILFQIYSLEWAVGVTKKNHQRFLSRNSELWRFLFIIFFLEYTGELCIAALIKKKKGEYKIQTPTTPTTPLPEKKLVTNAPVTEKTHDQAWIESSHLLSNHI